MDMILNISEIKVLPLVFRRVPLPETGCASYLTVTESGQARAMHGCNPRYCMDSSTCKCKACESISCPDKTEGTISIPVYDRSGSREEGTIKISSHRNGGQTSGFSVSRQIVGNMNPSDIPAVDQEGGNPVVNSDSDSYRSSDSDSYRSRGGSAYLARLAAVLG